MADSGGASVILRYGWVVVAAAVLAAAAYRMQTAVRTSDRSPSTSVRRQVEATTFVRQAIIGMDTVGRLPAEPAPRSAAQRAIDLLARLAAEQPTGPNIRRLVTARAAFGVGDPAVDLTRLRGIKGLPNVDVDRELADWSVVLGEQDTNDVEVAAVEQRNSQRQTGIFRELAAAVLWARHGRADIARKAIASAKQGTWVLGLATGAIILVLPTGLCILAAVAFVSLAARRHPLPAALLPTPLPTIDRNKAEALYGVFLTYLVCLAGVRAVAAPAVGFVLDRLPPSSLAAVRELMPIVVTLAALVPPWLVFRLAARRTGLSAADIGWHTRGALTAPVWSLLGYFATMPILLGASAISMRLFREGGSPVNPAISQMVALRDWRVGALLFLQAVVMAPLIEETLFRGVLFRALQGRLGAATSVLVTSGLFAVLHPQLPLGFLGIFCLGCAFNWLALHRGSLVAPTIAHAINNGVVFAYFVLLFGG